MTTYKNVSVSALFTIFVTVGMISLGCSDDANYGDDDTEDAGSGTDSSGDDTENSGDGSDGGTTDGDTDNDSTDGGEDSDWLEDCSNELLATVHDFEPSHPDFGCSQSGSGVTYGLVLENLDDDQKPILNPIPPTETGGSIPQITSEETFYQWFHSVPEVNEVLEITFPLAETEPGSGLWGWESDDYTVKPDEGAFTTEIHFRFMYKAGQVFSFYGDDDVWVFIDNKLALDLGGMHSVVGGEINLDELGLVEGQLYAIDMFHAERCYGASNFKIETSIDCIRPSTPPEK